MDISEETQNKFPSQISGGEAQRVGISKRDARSLVEKHNHERAEYYRYYTGQDWSYAQNYDLCLNTATLSYESCANMVMEYLTYREK